MYKSHGWTEAGIGYILFPLCQFWSYLFAQKGRQGENFLFQVTTLVIYGDPAESSAYIPKSADSDDQTPQII